MNTHGSRLKTIVNGMLKPLGIELRRIPLPAAVPELVDDPSVAMLNNQLGQPTAIRAPIKHCVIFNGLSLGPEGWHPLVAAGRELLTDSATRFEGSCLKRFYERWQPENALEALIGASLGPEQLRHYPPFLMHAPWLGLGPDDRLRSIQRIIQLENLQFGGSELAAEQGYGLQGPVSLAKGQIEYRRLANVLESIKRHGYDRSRGDITAQVLKRGSEYRFRIVHGHHRAAALAALGETHIPLIPRMILDLAESAHWPQVFRGVWSQPEAEAFFHHHFEFDSLSWAQRLRLV